MKKKIVTTISKEKKGKKEKELFEIVKKSCFETVKNCKLTTLTSPEASGLCYKTFF
jgi:hypothetical protein